MSKSENEKLVRAFFSEALNKKDFQWIDEFISPDYVWQPADDHRQQFARVSGLTAFKALVGDFFAAFPDFSTEVFDLVAGDDRVAARYVEGGTFSKTFFGYAPSGTKVFWSAITIYRIENGKIAEEWFQTDMEEHVRAASLAANK